MSFQPVPFFSQLLVPRDERVLAAAFGSGNLLAMAAQAIVHASQQKSPKAPLLLANPIQRLAMNELREEVLGEVLGIMVVVPFAPDVHVKRVAILLVQLRQCSGHSRGPRLTGRKNDAPMRRAK